MPEDTPDISGADSLQHDALSENGYVTVRCYVSGCGANRLVPCTMWGAPTVPEGWGKSGMVGQEWFACPEHLESMRHLLGLPSGTPFDG